MKPVLIEDFRAHVQRMHADGDKQFELEFNVSKITEHNRSDVVPISY